MDKFHEAQERFKRGSLFDGHAYARDMLVNYGNGGRKINLPQLSKPDYEAALQFRDAEKRRYSQLEQQLAHVTEQLRQSNLECAQYAAFITGKHERARSRKQQILKEEQQDVRAARGGVGDTSGDSGGGVLPPARDSGQDDTHPRQPEAIISGVSTTNESADASRRRSRGHDAQPKQEDAEAGRQISTERADPGRPRTDAADGAEPDVGGPAAEHGVAQ